MNFANVVKQANFITANPTASALGAGTLVGIASQVGGNIIDRQKEKQETEPVNLNPMEATKQTNINNGIALGAGAAATYGLYKLLGNIPMLKKRKLLNAVMAMIGGGAAGYAAWNMSNNYQNNTKQS